MGQPKNKEVINADTTSEQSLLSRKARRLRRAATRKIKKKSLKAKVADKRNIEKSKKVEENEIKVNIEKSKKVEENEIKVNGTTQMNVQIEAKNKETEAIVTDETSGGFIFMCNTRTKPECFRYKVLGLPANRRECVLRIKPGTRLFLYDFDLRLLYGIYKASSFGGMMLEPAAFNGCYPAQVRFEVESARAALPYYVFKDAIKDNLTGMRNMFKTELSSEQVKELIKLFPTLPDNQNVVTTNASTLQPTPTPAPAPAPAPVLSRAPVSALPPARVTAPTLASAPVHAPALTLAGPPSRALAPTPIPVPSSRPTNLSLQASFHSHPFENLSRNHAFAPIPRETALAPTGVMPHNPLSLSQESYRNLAAKQNPFMIPLSATGSAPGPFSHSYAQPLLGSLAHQPSPHLILPYDMPRTSNFVEGPSSGEPRPNFLHLTRATDSAAAYNIRNEQRIGNSDYLGPPPVSARYAFAGPISYRRGLP